MKLPFIALMMVILSPYQVSNLRGQRRGLFTSCVFDCCYFTS
nr:cold-regulated 413 inner membrane protein 1, chloroplastic-like [Ipomoea batatas]